MSTFFSVFFDLGSIPDDATGLRISWIHPFSGWLWFVIITVVATLSIWSYSRQGGHPLIRILLAFLRFSSLLLLVILISGPQVLFPRETVEQDVVMFMLDRSGSMNIEDTRFNGIRISRDEQLRRLIDDHPKTWMEIESRSDVDWFGFSSGVYSIDTDPSSPAGSESIQIPILEEPDGWNTDIPQSLRQVLELGSNRPVSAIILMSDGRSNQMPGRSLSRLLKQQGVPVLSVPLGSSFPVHDISITDVQHPDRAFIRDSIPVRLSVGSTGSFDVRNITAELVDQSSGEVVDSVSTSISMDDEEILLTAKMDDPGIRDFLVRLDSTDEDLFTENDSFEFKIDVVDRPVRVLYIEGYPRWEYRYLKNLLVREDSIESSVMLLSADSDFAQEGNVPISRLPRTSEEIDSFDLMIIGDVPAGFFSSEQLELFANQVSEKGMGLFWLGGPRNTPSSWSSSGMSDLLPMRSPLELEESTEPITISPTRFASSLGVLVLDPENPGGWVDELSDPETGWSNLQSMQIIDPRQLKPTSEVLASGKSSSSNSIPALLSMRYGSGQILYSAMDDIWRWRFGRGEELTDRWWIGLIRFLARQSLDTGGGTAELFVTPERITPGSSARISIRVHDQRLASTLEDLIPIEIVHLEGGSSVELELAKEDEEPAWESDWTPEQTGRFSIRVLHPILSELPGISGNGSFDVSRPDDEFRILDADHQLLEDISRNSGGTSVPPDSIDRIPDLLPNRDVLIENPIVVPIWNTGTFLFLLIGLLTLEWVVRRSIRMT